MCASPQIEYWCRIVPNLLEKKAIEDCERQQVADHIVASEYDQVRNLVGVVIAIVNGPNDEDSPNNHNLDENREADYSADDEAGVDGWIKLHFLDNLDCVNDVPDRVYDCRKRRQTVS